MTPPRAIAFDLDGTLADTAPDIAAALNAALAREGLAPAPLADARRWIGDGPDLLIARALAAQGLAVDAARTRRLRAGFDAATLAAPLVHGALFDGVAELLAALAGRVALAVATNKPTPLAREVLRAAGVLDAFDAVLGADTPARRKPAPALLHDAAAQLGVPAAALLMVGDSVNDLRAAAAAGCAAAWAGWGYGGALPPPDAGAAPFVAARPHELHALVSGPRTTPG